EAHVLFTIARMRGLLFALASILGTLKSARRSRAVLVAVVWVAACAGPPAGSGEGGGEPVPSAAPPPGGADPASRPTMGPNTLPAGPGLSPGFDIGDVMRQVHFAYRPEDSGWSGGHDNYRVHATVERFQVTP